MPVVIIGAGGHGKVAAEALRASGYELAGFVDPEPTASHVLGAPVLGGDDILPVLRQQGIVAAFVALGENRRRHEMSLSVLRMGYSLPTVIHPSAVISPSASLGAGVLVLPLVVVGPAVSIDDFVILNSGSVIEHDSTIGEAAHVAPGCALGGNVQVGARTLLGVGSAVRPDIRIGADVVVGAGAVVVSDIPDHAVFGGVPARQLRRGKRE